MLTSIIVTTTLAYITRYNDLSSCHNVRDGLCITASGYHTLNRSVACPRSIKLGTIVKIGETKYVCLDRTAKIIDGRFDIFDPSPTEDLLKWGKRKMLVTIYK